MVTYPKFVLGLDIKNNQSYTNNNETQSHVSKRFQTAHFETHAYLTTPTWLHCNLSLKTELYVWRKYCLCRRGSFSVLDIQVYNL